MYSKSVFCITQSKSHFVLTSRLCLLDYYTIQKCLPQFKIFSWLSSFMIQNIRKDDDDDKEVTTIRGDDRKRAI